LKVATIQMNSGPDVSGNLSVAGDLLSQAAAAGAVLAVLPENFAIMGAKEADRLAVAETPGAGPIQDAMAQLARKLSLWIVAGTMPCGPATPARSHRLRSCSMPRAGRSPATTRSTCSM
jgi:predicted amidohydrolase